MTYDGLSGQYVNYNHLSLRKKSFQVVLPASFRFHLTMDTLTFGCNLPTIRAVWELSPVRVRSC